MRHPRLQPVLLAADVHDVPGPGREREADARGDAALTNVLKGHPESFVLNVAIRCHAMSIGSRTDKLYGSRGLFRAQYWRRLKAGIGLRVASDREAQS